MFRLQHLKSTVDNQLQLWVGATCGFMHTGRERRCRILHVSDTMLQLFMLSLLMVVVSSCSLRPINEHSGSD